jgi:hypothetical protein
MSTHDSLLPISYLLSSLYLLYSTSRSSGCLAFMPILSEILSRSYGSDTRLSDWSFLRFFYFQANTHIVPEIKSQSLPSHLLSNSASTKHRISGRYINRTTGSIVEQTIRNQETAIFLSHLSRQSLRHTSEAWFRCEGSPCRIHRVLHCVVVWFVLNIRRKHISVT